jgi:hypothetical protein
MGGWLSRDSSSKLSTADEHHLARKCKSVATAYSKCHKANPNDPKACNNLQTSLVMCYAAGEAQLLSAAAGTTHYPFQHGPHTHTHTHTHTHNLAGIAVWCVAAGEKNCCLFLFSQASAACKQHVLRGCIKTAASAAAATCAFITHIYSLCLATLSDLCKQASDAHQKCYMSVINTGYYQVGGCQL